MEQDKEYFAFISYSHKDEEWAKWLQHELEHYHLPASFDGRTDVPQKLRPVFRDIDELSAGNLPEQIRHALANSKNLIVICSPQAAKSHLVNQDVETFISFGKTERIFPFIVEGESPSEFLPAALRNLPKNEERPGGDVCKRGRDAAFIKVVAGMLGVGFDSLWNRYEKEKVEEERKQREQRDNLARESHSFKNFAFISYSHEDMKQAERLDNFLFEFRLPTQVKEKHPNLRDTFHEIFRDNTGMGAATDLDYEIKRQLDQSEYLIVICSPNAVESDWVNKEIEYFKRKRGLEYIYPFVVDGIVNAKSPHEGKECMPKALRPYKGRAANISTYSFEHAIIEILAAILNIEVDEIWQRHVRLEEERKLKLKEQNDRLLIAQSRFLAEKANALVDEGDSYTARLLAIEALPKDLENPDRPYVVEAESAIRKASKFKSSILKASKNLEKAIFSPSNKFVLSFSQEGEILLWDSASGEMKFRLVGHHGSIGTASFSPDEKNILTSSGDGTMRIWNVETGECEKVINGIKHTVTIDRQELVDYYSINSAYYSPKGDKVLFICWDIHRATILDVCSGKIEKSITDPLIGPNASFDPSGKFFVTDFYQDKSLSIWDTENLCRIKNLTGHRGIIHSIKFSPDGKLIVSASSDKSIRIWDVAVGDTIRILRGHSGPVYDASFSNDGKTIVSASEDRTVRLWDVETGECIHIYTGHEVAVKSSSFSFDGQLILSASIDGRIRIWTNNNRNGYDNASNVPMVNALFVNACVKMGLLAYPMNPNVIGIWDIQSQTLIGGLRGHNDMVLSVGFCPEYNLIVTTSKDKTIRCWNATQLKCLKVLKPFNRQTECISFSSDYTLLLVSVPTEKSDGYLYIFETKSMKLLQTLQFPDTNAVAISDDKGMIAIGILGGNEGNTIGIYNREGKCLRMLRGHQSWINSISFSQDGLFLISSSSDQTSILWNVQTGEKVLSLIGVKATFGCSHDTICVVSPQNNLRVIDVATASVIFETDARTIPIVSYEISKERGVISIIYKNGVMEHWKFLPLQELIDQTRIRFKKRQLTLEERKKYYLE